MEKQKYVPNIAQSIGLFLMYDFVIGGILLLISFIVFRFTSNDLLIGSINSIISLYLVYKWINRKYTLDYREFISINHFKISHILPTTISGVGLTIILSELINRLKAVFPLGEFWINIIKEFNYSPTIWKLFIMVVIVAPIVEEVLFRGIILKGYLTHYSTKKALIVSAIFFGIVHLNPYQIVATFFAGIFIGWLYIRTKSLMLCIFAHSLNNLISIASLTVINIPGFRFVELYIIEFQPMWLNVLGVILLVSGLVWLRKCFENIEVKWETDESIKNTEDYTLEQ